jgi:hypothetical protein
MTFLAVERGFDFVTIYSCPDGTCKEVQKYSDFKRSRCCDWFAWFWYNVEQVEGFTDEVECRLLVLNTNEIRVRFTSDGPAPRDGDIATSKLVYKGFSAAYVASSLPVQAETIGCEGDSVEHMTGLEGTIIATIAWYGPWLASDKNDAKKEGYPPPHYFDQTDPLEKEVKYHGCDQSQSPWWQPSSPPCYYFRRGDVKWWHIVPDKTLDIAKSPMGIKLMFHSVALEDGLDELSIFTCNDGECTEVQTISGSYPFKGASTPDTYSWDSGSDYDSDSDSDDGGGQNDDDSSSDDSDNGETDTTDAGDGGNGGDDTQQSSNGTDTQDAGRRRRSRSRRARRTAADDTCHSMLLQADEVRIRLKSSFMPTNTSGFWIEYVANSENTPLDFNQASPVCDDETRLVTDHAACISFDPRGPPGLKTYWDEDTSPANIWGIPPNGRAVWVIRPQKDGVNATKIVLHSPDLHLEKGFDFLKLYSCKQGKCTQLYKTMTGAIRYTNSFCDIIQEAEELRVEMQIDGTNNIDSRFHELCYEAYFPDSEEQNVFNETTGFECPNAILTGSQGRILERIKVPTQNDKRQDPKTWFIDAGPNATSITLDFERYALFWGQSLILSWNCDAEGECADEKVLTIVRPWSMDWLEVTTEVRWWFTQECADDENIFECYLRICKDSQTFIRWYGSGDWLFPPR